MHRAYPGYPQALMVDVHTHLWITMSFLFFVHKTVSKSIKT